MPKAVNTLNRSEQCFKVGCSSHHKKTVHPSVSHPLHILSQQASVKSMPIIRMLITQKPLSRTISFRQLLADETIYGLRLSSVVACLANAEARKALCESSRFACLQISKKTLAKEPAFQVGRNLMTWVLTMKPNQIWGFKIVIVTNECLVEVQELDQLRQSIPQLENRCCVDTYTLLESNMENWKINRFNKMVFY